MADSEDQLTIVSNRLPVVLERRGGQWRVEPGSGGLIQAMRPILYERGGRWVGWPGVTEEDGDGWRAGLRQAAADSAYDFGAVLLTGEELEGYYEGFSNSVLWPLFHGFPDRCQFEPAYYEAYNRVNQKFAQVICEGGDEGLLWIHDYHLVPLAHRLRKAGHRGRLAFFLHIPFPSVENFSKLPWRQQLLIDLLHYDQIGFQTERDLCHFKANVDALGMSLGQSDPEAQEEARYRFELGGRVVEAGAYPIAIDYEAFARRSKSEEVEEAMEQLRRDIGACRMLLGVDRLDYSKGLIHRLKAYEQALERYPQLREDVVFFQLVVPSREGVDAYQQLKQEFDQIVGRINGRFSSAGWQPIHYLYNRVDAVQLCALYRFASVALVTPLRDGMNLVSKEYCASQIEDRGVLVLSEFAGAAEQLAPGAVVINPYDLGQTAEAIYRAVTMGYEERRRRMKAMRQVVKDRDVYWWAKRFFESAKGREITSPQVVESESVDGPGQQRAGQL